MTAKFGSHIFCGSLYERRIKIPRVFGANIPAAHTAYASSFIGVTGVSFVDCSDRTAVSTNSAGSAAGIRFWFERNVRIFLICPVASVKIQRTEYTTFKFGCDFIGKLCQLFCIVPIRTPGGKLTEDGVFGNGGDCSHADEATSFKGVLQLGQSVIPLTVAVNCKVVLFILLSISRFHNRL